MSLTIELNENGALSRCSVVGFRPIVAGLTGIWPCIGSRDLGYLHSACHCAISEPHLGKGNSRWESPLPPKGALIGHSAREVGSWHHTVWSRWYRWLKGGKLLKCDVNWNNLRYSSVTARMISPTYCTGLLNKVTDLGVIKLPQVNLVIHKAIYFWQT